MGLNTDHPGGHGFFFQEPILQSPKSPWRTWWSGDSESPRVSKTGGAELSHFRVVKRGALRGPSGGPLKGLQMETLELGAAAWWITWSLAELLEFYIYIYMFYYHFTNIYNIYTYIYIICILDNIYTEYTQLFLFHSWTQSCPWTIWTSPWNLLQLGEVGLLWQVRQGILRSAPSWATPTSGGEYISTYFKYVQSIQESKPEILDDFGDISIFITISPYYMYMQYAYVYCILYV